MEWVGTNREFSLLNLDRLFKEAGIMVRRTPAAMILELQFRRRIILELAHKVGETVEPRGGSAFRWAR